MDDLKLDDFYFQDSILVDELEDIDLSALNAGKFLRSRLLSLIAEMVNLEAADTKKLGRVVEMVHNATLTHDDVIDNSHTRRGHPSVPALINNKKSVLVGDYMLAKALHELSDFNNPKLTQELTLTLKELVEGEWIQYENTNPYKITKTLYETLAVKKTGSLFRWSFIAPLIATEDKYQLMNSLSRFGELLGIVFQLTDDLIDFNPESKKTYGLDFRNNNINYVLHYVGSKYPELGTKFLRTEEISDLTSDEETLLLECVNLAKKDITTYLEELRDILDLIKEKHADLQHAFLDELSLILDLIKDRVF